MNYEEFKQELEQCVRNLVMDSKMQCNVDIHEVFKNNGIKFDAICVSEKSKKAGPSFNLEHYYDCYCTGTPVLCLAEEIINLYNSTRIVALNLFQNMLDFESIKDYIFLRLVNYENNKEMLNKCPYIKYLDLAITFRCGLQEDDGFTSALIFNDIKESWSISLEELYKIALSNTYKTFPYEIRSLDNVMLKILKQELNNTEFDEIEQALKEVYIGTKFYILSNTTGLNGATCILYDNVIRNFAEKMNSNIFILPSSIHEVLLLSESIEMNVAELKDMIKSANMQSVGLIDVLSDSVYYYDRSTNEITIA